MYELESLFENDYPSQRSNLFLVVKNPLDCILPNQLTTYQVEQEDDLFEAEGEIEKSICRISLNESLISLKFPREKYVFSDIFGCFTTLSFYAALVTELKKLAKIFDFYVWKREAVWMQFFTLIGADRQSDEMLLPIIMDTFGDSEEVNLKDLEIFVLSFLLVLNLIPNVLSTSKKPIFLPSDKKLKVLMKKNAMAFFKTYAKYLSIYLGHMEPSLTIDVDEVAIIVESKMLTYWIEELDKIDVEKKEKLARLSRIPEMSSFAEGNPIDEVIEEWILDIENHKSEIRKLFQAVVALNERRILTEECFSRDHVSEKFEQFLHEIAKEEVITTAMITALLVDNSSSIARRAASVPIRTGGDHSDEIKHLIESKFAQSSENIRMQPLVTQRKKKDKLKKKPERTLLPSSSPEKLSDSFPESLLSDE